MNNLANILERSIVVPNHVLFRSLRDEVVMLDLKRKIYYGLDSVGASMWGAVTRTSSPQAALAELTAEYDVAEDEITRDFEALLLKLVDRGLLISAASSDRQP